MEASAHSGPSLRDVDDVLDHIVKEKADEARQLRGLDFLVLEDEDVGRSFVHGWSGDFLVGGYSLSLAVVYRGADWKTD